MEETYRPIVGSKRDIIYALIDIIRYPDSPSRSVKDGLKALFGLALYPLNRSTLVEFGAVAALFGLVVEDGRVGVVEDSTAVIAQVAGCEESLEAFKGVCGIRVLMDLLDPGTGWTSRIKENAISGLLNLVQCNGVEVEEEIRGLDLDLELVLEGLREVGRSGSAKGKRKAEVLVKVLEGGTGRSSSLRSREDSGSDVTSDPSLDSRSY